MVRRSFLGSALALLGIRKGQAAPARPSDFPPVPEWRPSFAQPLERIIDRVSYYTNGKRDFLAFRNGTCVILEGRLNDDDAEAFSLKVLSDIFHYHPDMSPSPMDDGNILVQYNHPAVNVVLTDIAKQHWLEIEQRHLDGLARAEVLITPLGSNVFDDFGKQALLGRSYMFMDAQAPEIMRIKRAD